MRKGWDFAGSGTSALCIVALVAGLASGCKVYRQNLLPNETSGAGAPTPVGGMSGGGGNASRAGASGAPDAGPPPVEADPCENGECWWSSDGDECPSAGMPRPADRPSGADESTQVPEFYLGFSKVRLGAQTADGMQSEDAWTSFGFDLDGSCTNSASCNGRDEGSCKAAGPAVPFDGQMCRDNTFSRLLPMIALGPELGGKFGVSEDTFNCQLWRGGYNMIVRVSGYNGAPDDPRVRVDYYLSNGIEDTLRWQCPTPEYRSKYRRWSPARTWGIDERALSSDITTPGKLPQSKHADADAYVKSGYLVARVPDGTEQGFLGDGKPYRGFIYTPKQGVYVGRLSKGQDGTWELNDGLIAGRIAKDDLIRAFRETGFCETGALSTFYQIMVEYLTETVDVLASGDANAEEPCDAMSYGFAFEAAQVTPGKSVALAKRVECCEPGKTAEECMRTCGDGKVGGDEKCDPAIAEGAPGGCPKACESNDPCKPRKLVGSECAAECQETVITMIGAGDGCCPAGADIDSDADCKAQCGNGVVEAGETCDPPGTCQACPSNPCFTLRMSGSADACNIRCEYQPVTACMGGDGCCPAMCNRDTDTDCAPTCGDQMFQEGELCEAGTGTPCPMNCDDGKACTTDRRSGSASNCSVSCFSTPVTDARNGDDCCPAGANANTDDDCQPKCGNRAVERGEQCDDGNYNPGDGCVDCRTESEQMQCLMKIGTDDACARCTCVNCADEGRGCYDHPNPDKARLCRDLVECSYENDCGTPDCYCGDVSLFGCLAGAANGRCKGETERAASADNVLEIEMRSTDLNYPLGIANALFTCAARYCPMECGRTN